MNLLIILILDTFVSFVDTTLMVLPGSPSPDYREQDCSETPSSNCHVALSVDYSFAEVNDTEMAEHEIDFKTTEVSTEVNTDIWDEIEESFLTTPYPEKLPPKPIVPRYKNVPVETHCDASTLVFMSHVNAIFNDMILNKGEKFNSENIEEYTNFLKETMTYFGDMKVAQL